VEHTEDLDRSGFLLNMSTLSNRQLVRSAFALFALVLVSGVVGCSGGEATSPPASTTPKPTVKNSDIKTGPAVPKLDPSATLAQPGAKAGGN